MSIVHTNEINETNETNEINEPNEKRGSHMVLQV